MTKLYLLGFVFTTLFLCSNLRAQEEVNLCTQTLKNAQKFYDEGKLEGIPTMLGPCIEEGFSRSEKLEAYRLQILTHLFLDENAQAEVVLLRLLKEDPEYKVNPALDPAEFINLYNSYRTLPLYAIGVKGGLNLTNVYVSQPYGVQDTENHNGDFKSNIGYQLGVGVDFLLKNQYTLATEFLYVIKSYKHTNTLLGYSNLELKETQSWLELPVMLKYTMGKKKLRYYVQAGPSVGMLMNSNLNISRVDSATGSNQAVGPAIGNASLRHKLNYNAVLGGGIKYKIGYGFLVLDFRFNLGIRNISNPSKRYSNPELIYKYGYIDNNQTLSNMMISIGYYKSFYKPKKVIQHAE